MTAARTPFAKESKGSSDVAFYSSTQDTVPRNSCFPKGAIQQGPGKFREGKREGRNDHRNRLAKNPQSSKVREGSGKGNGKVETDFSKTRNPGRSGKVWED